MGRLIDSDEAYKVLADYYHIRMELQHKALKEAIGRVPTADAVEVVRCKDCIYKNGKINSKGFEVCDATGMDITDNDFCSWGERRVDAIPVVRCKDCKWCHAGYCEKADDIIPFGFTHHEWENFYCAWGERKDE